MEFSQNDLEKIARLVEQDLKNQLDHWGTKIIECLINFHQLESNNLTVQDLLGTNSTISNTTSFNERLTKIEKQQERITKYLDKFISILTYSERVQDQIDVINNRLDELSTVELLKGVIELPKPNTDGKEKDYLDFYTIKVNGECGMSLSTLASLAGVNKSSISRLENTLLHKSPSHYLQSYVNQDFTLLRSDQVKLTIDGKNVGNLTIYKSDYCAAVITHYAMKGNKIALHYLANYCAMGMTNWIHDITGYTAK